MNMSNQGSEKNELKKPIAIYLLASCFLLAPIGNILTSLIMQRVPNWYKPNVFYNLLKVIPPTDLFWLGLVFVCGLFLLKAHKLSWSFAIFAMMVVLGMNIYKMYYFAQTEQSGLIKTQIALSIFFTTAVLLISFYFRYPYLDRRTTWLSTSSRMDVDIPVELVFSKSHEVYYGVIENISMSGSRIHLNTHVPAILFLEKIASDKAYLKMKDLNDIALEVELVKIENQNLRLRFKNLSDNDKAMISNYMYNQKQKMIGA